MIDPNKELFFWGPIDGVPLYIDTFTRAFVLYPKYSNISWPDCIGYFKDEKITFVLEDSTLKERGETLARKYLGKESLVKKEFDNWINTTQLIEEYDKKKSFENFSDETLVQAFKDFDDNLMDFWVKSFLPEMGNWGAEKLLIEQIRTFDKSQFNEIMETMSAPEELSFFQREELELSAIKLSGKKNRLKEHSRKYHWISNSYREVYNRDFKYFEKILKNVSEEKARQKIKEFEVYFQEVAKKKKKTVKKYNLSDEIQIISQMLSFFVWWQDLRKKYIFMSNSIIEKFAEEICGRVNISFDKIKYYNIPELIHLLEKGTIINVDKRCQGYAIYFHDNENNEYIEGEAANELVSKFFDVKIEKDASIIGGIVVSSPGGSEIVKGLVKIMFSPSEIAKMKKGDVLVAPMTSPDYIMAMKQACAIVTDTGGMTCHAAIVSRELKVPCIVGTKLATKVFKDGDLVEVDTKRGIVRKI